MSLEEREQLAILMAEGQSLREIAGLLGRSHSSLSRELRRNQVRQGRRKYMPAVANEKALARRGGVGRPLLNGPEVRAYVHEKLKLGWSPEQISGSLPKVHPGLSISHEAIYQYVYHRARELIPCLPRKHKYRYARYQNRNRKRSRIPNRIGISERPAVADQRKQFGHWESDAIVSNANKQVLNVLVERKSRLLRITRLRQNTAALTRDVIVSRLLVYPDGARRSITYDNGSENAQHEQINAQLGTRSYFCEPYHSWEKGTVENTNGLIRRFFPKKTDLAKLTDEEIQRVESLLNNRPRKCLGYQTPGEVFLRLSGALRC